MLNEKIIPTLILHLIPWGMLLTGPFYSIFTDPQISTHQFIHALIIFCVVIGSFYLNYLYLIPRFLFKKKFIAFAASVGALVLVVALLNTIHPEAADQFRFAPAAVMMLAIFSVAARMTARWLNQDDLNTEIKKEQLQTELAFLKNQVSPHFLFNTLNNIYSLTESDPEKAREVTHGLSKLMRYLLYESEKNEKVTLGREIKFLETYLKLMKVRLPENVVVSFDHGSEMDNTELPPLLFIPFVENAFKHGVSFQDDCTVKITLNRNKDAVDFSVINLIPAHVKAKDVSGGLGLQNIRRRLELLFGEGNYSLVIHKNEFTYDVQLKIPVNGN